MSVFYLVPLTMFIALVAGLITSSLVVFICVGLSMALLMVLDACYEAITRKKSILRKLGFH